MEQIFSPKSQKVILWLIIIGVLSLIIFTVTKTILHELRPRQIISLNGMTFRADVVDTPKARKKGLSERDKIRYDEAMLFVFEEDGSLPMVMRGMKFPIDIIWLDKNQRIVHIERDAQPGTYPHTIYESPVPARYVVEVVSGQAPGLTGSRATLDVASEGL